ncbi:MAG: hypothetical protein AAF633_26350 [Chloroflexota bacterium]
MSDKQKETVDEVVAIIRETLVEVATALAARDSIQDDIQQQLDRINQDQESQELIEAAASGPSTSRPEASMPISADEPDPEPELAASTLIAEDNRFLDLIDTTPDEVPAVLEPHHLEYIPEKLPSIGMHKTLWQVAVMFFGLLIFVNLPIVPPGIAIARVISDTQSLVVREGLIFKSEDQVEVYVLDDQLKKRWITDIEAFDF